MKLHIGNLPKVVTETELSELITPFASPMTLEIVKDSRGESRGYAFADFSTDDEARAVLTAIDGREMSGQQLKLGEARPRRTESRPRA